MSELLTIPPPHPPPLAQSLKSRWWQKYNLSTPPHLWDCAISSRAWLFVPSRAPRPRPAGNPLCHLRLLLCAVCAVPPSWFLVARIRKHLRRFMLCACEPAKSFQGRACDLACGRLRAFHPCCADTISHSGGARLGDYFAERAIRPPL